MKFKHGVSVLLASTILMAGCTTDRGEIKIIINKSIKQTMRKKS